MKIPNESSVDYLKGSWFIFNEPEGVIALFSSPFSGKETIYFNGSIVSKTRNYKTKSFSEFETGENYYELTLSISKLFSGRIACKLSKNGSQHKKLESKHNPNYFVILALAILFLSGITLIAGFGAPSWVSWLLYIVFMYVFLKLSSDWTQVIER